MAYPMVPYSPYTATLRNRRPLVRRRGERDYAPIIIDSRQGGQLRVTERHLEKYMPSARNILRRTGNRRLTKEACFGGRFSSREDESASQDVYNWLTSRLVDPRYPSRTISTLRGPRTEDVFGIIYQELQDAMRYGDPTEIGTITEQALRFFRMLSEHLGRRGALNPMLLHEILQKASQFTTVFQYDEVAMFDLLDSMFTMTNSVVVLETLMEGMAWDAQENLLEAVAELNNYENSDLIDEILYFLIGMHRMNRSTVIRYMSGSI